MIVREMFSKLLVPIDGSDNSFRALNHAIFLSKKIVAQTTVLHAMENLPFAYVESQRALNAIILKYQEESENILNKSRDIGGQNGATSIIIDYSKKENYDTSFYVISYTSARYMVSRYAMLINDASPSNIMSASGCNHR